MSTRKRLRVSRKSDVRFIDDEESTLFVPVQVSLLDMDRSQTGSDLGFTSPNSKPSEPIVQSASDSESSDHNGLLVSQLSDGGESIENQETDNYTDVLIQKLVNSDAINCLDGDSPCAKEIDAIMSLNKDQELEEMWTEAREHLINENEDQTTGIEDGWFEVEEILQFCSTDKLNAGQNSDKDKDNDQHSQAADECVKNTEADQEPLYDGSTLTIGTVMVLLALFVIKHNLSGEAIEHLLSIIAAVLPSSNILPRTISRFRKYFCRLKNPFVLHNYCSFCLTYLGSKKSGNCPNAHCLKDLEQKGGISFFLEIPLIHQLQTMFSRSGFPGDLQHRFRRKKKFANNIEDVYDGEVYQKLIKQGILQSENNFSFIFNTDGVPVFKSSKISIWPLLLVINELPYRKRMATENMLLAGLWFGEKMPAMWTFSCSVRTGCTI